jgi:hypothetical protein
MFHLIELTIFYCTKFLTKIIHMIITLHLYAPTNLLLHHLTLHLPLACLT